jgi:hypothetical protein
MPAKKPKTTPEEEGFVEVIKENVKEIMENIKPGEMKNVIIEKESTDKANEEWVKRNMT